MQRGHAALSPCNQKYVPAKQWEFTAGVMTGAMRMPLQELRDTKELVLAAVKQKGYALRYASEELPQGTGPGLPEVRAKLHVTPW